MADVTAKAIGEVASFYSPKKGTEITSLKVHFSPKQSGEGDPSPDNVRPVEGWNGVTVRHVGKNIGRITRYSATSTSSPTTGTPSLTNNYGTTLSTTTAYEPIVINQSQYDETLYLHHYKNGYFVIDFDTLEFGQKYIVSFRVTNIINNPLNASISDIQISEPSGKNYRTVNKIINNDRLIFNIIPFMQNQNVLNRHTIPVYNCGMSCTISDIMVTKADEQNQEYEPYNQNIISIDWSSEHTYQKNLVDPQTNPIWNGTAVYTINNDGSVTVTGSDGRGWTSSQITPLSLPTGTYSFNWTGARRIQFVTSNDAYDSNAVKVYTKPFTFTLKDNGGVKWKSTSDSYPITITVSINLLSPAIPYGGYIDLITGDMVVDRGYLHLDGTQSWLMSSSTSHSAQRPTLLNVQPNNGKYEPIISDKLTGYSDWNPYEYMAVLNNGGHLVIGLPEEYSTSELVNEWVTSLGGIDIVYPLAEPVIYHMTSQRMTTLLGHNNFFSNVDYIEVEYALSESCDIQMARRRILMSAPHTQTTLSGTAIFATDMTSPVKNAIVDFVPYQSGEGTPSPTNIRMINGYNNITAIRSGKNILRISDEYKIFSSSTYNKISEIGEGSFSWTADVNGGFIIPCKSNTTYTYSCNYPDAKSGFYLRVWYCSYYPQVYDDWVPNMLINQSYGNTGPSAVFTTPKEANFLVIGAYIYDAAAQNGGTVYNLQVELGGGATEYEPYASISEKTIDFGDIGTIYGGRVDLTSGELTQEYVIIDKPWSEWTLNGTQENTVRKYAEYTTDVIPTGATGYASYCNAAPHHWSYSENDTPHFYTSNKRRVYMWMPNDFDETQHVQVACKLATPITYQLSSQQVKTARGENNIWSNNGDVNITFWTHSIPKKMNVVWNQWMKPLSSSNYKSYNTTNNYTSVSYENGLNDSNDNVAIVEWLSGEKIGYNTCIIPSYNISVKEGDVLYESHMIYPSVDNLNWGIEFAGGIQLSWGACRSNIWTRIPYIRTCIKTQAYSRLYVPNLKTPVTTTDPTGLICRTKALYLINLTTMFGAGNEPTDVGEFEHLCMINGIDLTKQQPYDKGTQRQWIMY